MPVPAADDTLYTTLATVKAALGKDTADDRDDLIQQAIAAASRQIDRRTGRRFYADVDPSARFYSPTSATMTDLGDLALLVDDIASADDLAVATGSAGSWTTVDTWEAGPDNALAYGRPITQIRSSYGWVSSLSRVQVTARWGWPAVPDEIAQAAALLAARLYRRKDSPQGVMGSADWGFTRVSRTDPDVEALIAPFIRPIVF